MHTHCGCSMYMYIHVLWALASRWAVMHVAFCSDSRASSSHDWLLTGRLCHQHCDRVANSIIILVLLFYENGDGLRRPLNKLPTHIPSSACRSRNCNIDDENDSTVAIIITMIWCFHNHTIAETNQLALTCCHPSITSLCHWCLVSYDLYGTMDGSLAFAKTMILFSFNSIGVHCVITSIFAIRPKWIVRRENIWNFWLPWNFMICIENSVEKFEDTLHSSCTHSCEGVAYIPINQYL